MILLSLEEFTARRKPAQKRLEDELRPTVERALDGTVNTDGYREVLSEVARLWRDAYTEESGTTGVGMPNRFRDQIEATLRRTDRPNATEATVDRIVVWLATAILSHATLVASTDDEAELFVEWVTMHDDKVRAAHRDVGGDVRPIGDPFHVSGFKMRYPGDPSVPIELWINCRCTLRPILAEEALVAGFRDVAPSERKKDAKEGRAMPDGSYPIDNCQDLRNAIQAIGRAKDPGKVKSHIKRRKSSLGCPDVQIPDGWALEGDEMSEDEKEITEVTAEEAETPVEDVRVPWFGVMAPEGVRSGDGRRFKEGSLRSRPLPLPLTWQKQSSDGHNTSLTVAKAERMARKDSEVRSNGYFLMSPEADEVVGLIAEFGRFGVSVDADDAAFEFSEEEEVVDFSDARICSACIVSIPAFAEAWIMLGEPPEDWYEGAEDLAGRDEAAVEEEEGLAASAFGPTSNPTTMDGPGWLTHPVDTDRLRDYWVRGPGAAKIGWGAPGDFNRCRLNLSKYVKPQYLSGYCANRHKDALGIWPGEHLTLSANLTDTSVADAVTLVASVTPTKAPAKWFVDPQLTQPSALTITEEGRVFGHIAEWTTCHLGYPGECVTAPRSTSEYAYFLLGQVLTDMGPVATGSLTIGGPHAPTRLRAQQAMAHYDNSCAVFADVNVGEDEYGIWCAGWIRPGTPTEMVHAARASKLSGDWRKINGEYEMIAALGVNTPGLPVRRVAAGIENGEQITLVAAGMVVETEPPAVAFDVGVVAEAVLRALTARDERRAEMLALASRMNGGQ